MSRYEVIRFLLVVIGVLVLMFGVYKTPIFLLSILPYTAFLEYLDEENKQVVHYLLLKRHGKENYELKGIRKIIYVLCYKYSKGSE